MPELVLQLTRAGFLALLWLFVLVALRVVRSDLYAASGLRALVPGGGRVAARTGRGRTPRQLLVTQGGNTVYGDRELRAERRDLRPDNNPVTVHVYALDGYLRSRPCQARDLLLWHGYQ